MTSAVEQTVAALDARLRGPRRSRAGLLDEVRDGLLDAASAHHEAGLGADDAQRRAVAEFGDVDELAPLYQDELAAAQGRRTAALIAVAFPGMLLVWDAMWRTQAATMRSWPDMPAGAMLLPVLTDVVSVVGGMLALVTWLILGRAGSRTGRRLTAALAVLGAVGLLLVLGMSATMLVLVLGDAASSTSAALPLVGALTLAMVGTMCRSLVCCARVAPADRSPPMWRHDGVKPRRPGPISLHDAVNASRPGPGRWSRRWS